MPLFMVIETFRRGRPGKVREKFLEHGRMMGPDLNYVSSWIAEDGLTCYQLMEASRIEAFDSWKDAWADLVDFEIVPVAPSAEFWASWEAGQGAPSASN